MIDAQRLVSSPLAGFDATCYRHQAPKYDPLDGHGARLHGGRFTPPGSFPTLYLCTSLRCVTAELQRLGQRQVIGVEALLPRAVYEYSVSLSRVLDLTSGEVLEQVGLREADVTAPDWRLTQELGKAAHSLDFQAIRAPSALGVDEILAVFLTQLGDDRLEARLLGTWESLDDLPT